SSPAPEFFFVPSVFVLFAKSFPLYSWCLRDILCSHAGQFPLSFVFKGECVRDGGRPARYHVRTLSELCPLGGVRISAAPERRRSVRSLLQGPFFCTEGFQPKAGMRDRTSGGCRECVH